MSATEPVVDERLLIEAAQHDPSRFAELYESNFDRVYAYIARRVKERDVAEDVTSEVFHQALANIRQFEYRGLPFIAWLLGIAANVLASRWRSDRTGRELSSEILEQQAVDDSSMKEGQPVSVMVHIELNFRLY